MPQLNETHLGIAIGLLAAEFLFSAYADHFRVHFRVRPLLLNVDPSRIDREAVNHVSQSRSPTCWIIFFNKQKTIPYIPSMIYVAVGTIRDNV